MSRFWLYPRMQIEKSERSKRDIVASRENELTGNSLFKKEISIKPELTFKWGGYHLENYETVN